MPFDSQLNAQVVAVSDLCQSTRTQMFALFQNYYDGVDMALFTRDLTQKQFAILMYDGATTLRGFSTVQVMNVQTETGEIRAIFSGDTIIHNDFWGQQVLPHAFCRLAGQIKKQAPELPLYWLLIVKGHRTYRFLPAFARRFYPTWREPTPSHLQEIKDQLARHCFGETYRADTGLLQFSRSRGHLRADWAEVAEAVAKKPDAAFFLERNPGYIHGDELVCLTELDTDNLRFAARTAFCEGLRTCTPGSN